MKYSSHGSRQAILPKINLIISQIIFINIIIHYRENNYIKKTTSFKVGLSTSCFTEGNAQ
jgi:hypothetical protein